MSTTSVLTPTEYEQRLQRYLYERSEEGRAVRVGEKEISEQAEIVARYTDLFTREQLRALEQAEDGASADRERLYRLRKTCEAGIAAGELAAREDEFENRLLAERIEFRGESLPLRAAQAQLAILPDYADREELGRLQSESSAGFNPERLELIHAGEELAAELSGEADPVARNEEEKGVSLRDLSRVLEAAGDASAAAFAGLRERWFERLLGPDRAEPPSSYHVAWMRRLSPLESTYAKDRATEVCLDTLTKLGFDLANERNIRLDLDDRPQKAPRACVIASDPPSVVHLITRAQGGLHDYQAFLHEAGHALHYAGCDPALPYTYRRHLARPRADRDLLVHLRGDLARAGLARRATSASPTSRRRERRGDDASSRRCSSAATRRSCATSSASGRASPPTAARRPATRSS